MANSSNLEDYDINIEYNDDTTLILEEEKPSLYMKVQVLDLSEIVCEMQLLIDIKTWKLVKL